MLSTVCTFLDCRRPAFFECAVTKPTVSLAGRELADHLVGAACNKTWLCTTAMFGAKTLAFRGGDAA